MSKAESGWVVGVLVLIIGATAINMTLSERRSRDAQRKSDLRSLAAAVEEFHDQFTYYPEAQDGKIVACGDLAYRNQKYYFDVCEWGNNFTPLHYYSGGRVPTDPKVLEGWQYSYASDGINYQLYGSLEDQNDEELKSDIVNLGLLCGDSICNFAVQN